MTTKLIRLTGYAVAQVHRVLGGEALPIPSFDVGVRWFVGFGRCNNVEAVRAQRCHRELDQRIPAVARDQRLDVAAIGHKNAAENA